MVVITVLTAPVLEIFVCDKAPFPVRSATSGAIGSSLD